MRRRALHATAIPHREFAKLGVYFAMSRKVYALFLQLSLRIFSFHLKMKTALEDEKYFPDGFTLETRWKLLLQIKLFSDFFCILTFFADNLEMFYSDEMSNKLTQFHEFFDINFIVILSKNVFLYINYHHYWVYSTNSDNELFVVYAKKRQVRRIPLEYVTKLLKFLL